MKKWIEITVAALALGATATAVSAQRDPAYQAARSSGLVGEKIDGYLGFVSPPSPSVKKLVDSLNIKRKAVYVKTATSQGVRPADAAFAGGCNNIRRTKAGEYYQAPGGNWVKRSGGAPQLDARCPR